MSNKLIDILKSDFQIMKLEMERSSIEGRGTPQEISDRRETLVRTFFKKYYPFPYRVAKGQICDSYGNESCSVDCVILNPIHPYTYDSKEENMSVILADGVDFAVECKSNLNSEDEIHRVLNQCRSVKKLKKVTTGVFGKNPKEFNYHIPYIIWANKSSYTIEKLITIIVEYYEKNNITSINQFDVIVIDGNHIIFNVGINDLGGENSYLPGLYYIECADDTLAHLLWAMTNFIGAAPSFKNILRYYTQIAADLLYFPELNEKLRKIK